MERHDKKNEKFINAGREIDKFLEKNPEFINKIREIVGKIGIGTIREAMKSLLLEEKELTLENVVNKINYDNKAIKEGQIIIDEYLRNTLKESAKRLEKWKKKD